MQPNKTNNMKQQTPIEWLKEQLEQHGHQYELDIKWETFDELYLQASVIEKVHLIEAFKAGTGHAFRYNEDGLEYYNETYKNK